MPRDLARRVIGEVGRGVVAGAVHVGCETREARDRVVAKGGPREPVARRRAPPVEAVQPPCGIEDRLQEGRRGIEIDLIEPADGVSRVGEVVAVGMGDPVRLPATS